MLPLNFHKTFLPDRRLIGALLHYAALGKSGSYQEIAAETGIPMGRSTGKVPAMLDYARGMGLVELAEAGTSVKAPRLTPFGRAAYANDPYLGQPLTQWLAHMNLCRRDIGAVAWRAVFVDGWRALGDRFDHEQVESYLALTFGAGRSRTGPLIRTYVEDSALLRANVLRQTDSGFERRKAPLDEPFAAAHVAMLLTLMETFFAGHVQVTVTDLERETGWFRSCGWDDGDVERLCALLEATGAVAVDRLMRPWVLERRAMALDAWAGLYAGQI